MKKIYSFSSFCLIRKHVLFFTIFVSFCCTVIFLFFCFGVEERMRFIGDAFRLSRALHKLTYAAPALSSRHHNPSSTVHKTVVHYNITKICGSKKISFHSWEMLVFRVTVIYLSFALKFLQFCINCLYNYLLLNI